MKPFGGSLPSCFRWAVTLALFGYVFACCVSLDDSLLLRDGREIRGEIASVSAQGAELILPDRSRAFFPAADIADRPNVDPRSCRDLAESKEIRPGFRTTCKRIDFPLYFAFQLLIFAAFLVNSLRLQILLRSQSLPISWPDSLRINLIGQFFNQLLPGFTGGDLARAYYLAKGSKQKTEMVMAVVMDRIMGFAGLIALASAMSLCLWNQPSFALASKVILSVAASGVLCFLFLWFAPERIEASRSPVLRAVAAICRYRSSPKPLLAALLLSILTHVLNNTAIFGFARAMGIADVPWFVFFLYVPVGFLVMALPISISGWGMGEAVFGFLFAGAGVPFEQGVALCLLLRLALVEMGVAGGVVWIFAKRGIQSRDGGA